MSGEAPHCAQNQPEDLAEGPNDGRGRQSRVRHRYSLGLAFAAVLLCGVGGARIAAAQTGAAVFVDELPEGRVNVFYDATVAAPGAPADWSYGIIDGALPTSLGLESNGRITGTPESGGVFEIDVFASSPVGGAGKRFTLTIQPVPSAPEILTTALPSAVLDQRYEVQLAVRSATPVGWSISEGRLPPGLALVDDTIVGTPTVVGNFFFEVRAGNASVFAEQILNIDVLRAGTVPPPPDAGIGGFVDGGVVDAGTGGGNNRGNGGELGDVDDVGCRCVGDSNPQMSWILALFGLLILARRQRLLPK